MVTADELINAQAAVLRRVYDDTLAALIAGDREFEHKNLMSMILDGRAGVWVHDDFSVSWTVEGAARLEGMGGGDPVPIVHVHHFTGSLKAWHANIDEWLERVCEGMEATPEIRWKGRPGWARLLVRRDQRLTGSRSAPEVYRTTRERVH